MWERRTRSATSKPGRTGESDLARHRRFDAREEAASRDIQGSTRRKTASRCRSGFGVAARKCPAPLPSLHLRQLKFSRTSCYVSSPCGVFSNEGPARNVKPGGWIFSEMVRRLHRLEHGPNSGGVMATCGNSAHRQWALVPDWGSCLVVHRRRFTRSSRADGFAAGDRARTEGNGR